MTYSPGTSNPEKGLVIMATKVKRKPKPQAKRPMKNATKLRSDGLREGSDGAKLVDTVCRKQGATHAELCAVVKWKQCLPYMLKMAAKARVKLRKEREAREIRYFGSAA